MGLFIELSNFNEKICFINYLVTDIINNQDLTHNEKRDKILSVYKKNDAKDIAKEVDSLYRSLALISENFKKLNHKCNSFYKSSQVNN